MHKLGAFAIINDAQGRILLCHRTDIDAWNLPGGQVEHSETPWEAVKREVMEEVGMEVDVIRLIGVYSIPHEYTVAFTFLCNKAGGELRLSNEADSIDWFEKDKLPFNTLPRHAQRIEDASSLNSNVILRMQTLPVIPS